MRIASYSLKFFVHYSMPITLALLSQADFRSTADRQNRQVIPADTSPISSESTDPIKSVSPGSSTEVPSTEVTSSNGSSSGSNPETKSEPTSSDTTEPPKIAETPSDQTSSSPSPTTEKPLESTGQPTEKPSDNLLPEAIAAASAVATTATDLAPMASASETVVSSETSAKMINSEQSQILPQLTDSQTLTPMDSQIPKVENKSGSDSSSSSAVDSTSASQSTPVAELVKVDETTAKSSEAVASVSALAVSAEAVPVKPDHSALPVGYESAQIQTPMESPPMVNSSIESKVDSPAGLTTSVVEKSSPIPETNPAHVTSPETSAPVASESPKADIKEVQATSTQSSETNPAPIVSPSAGVADIAMPAGFALANEGETWQDVSRRVIGDDRWADLLWKENRDLHHGQFETRPLVGRLIRVPKVKRSDGINPPASEVAIKSN